MANYSTYVEKELEKKSRRTGWIVTIVVHLLILLFFWLYNVWPFEPPIENHYGMEINFGISDVGSGDVQNEAPPSAQENENPNQDEPSEAAAANNADAQPEPNEANENIEAFDQDEAPPIANENNKVEEEQVNEQVEEQPVEQHKEETPTETQNPNNNNADSENDKNDAQNSASAQENNNGDDTDKVGDKGQENGEINQSDIYKGTPGDGGGTGAQITGWYTTDQITKAIVPEKTGKIVFYIKIDELGDVVTVTVKESTVSASTANKYREQILKMSFEQKDRSEDPAEFSEGTFTVILEAR